MVLHCGVILFLFFLYVLADEEITVNQSKMPYRRWDSQVEFTSGNKAIRPTTSLYSLAPFSPFFTIDGDLYGKLSFEMLYKVNIADYITPINNRKANKIGETKNIIAFHQACVFEDGKPVTCPSFLCKEDNKVCIIYDDDKSDDVVVCKNLNNNLKLDEAKFFQVDIPTMSQGKLQPGVILLINNTGKLYYINLRDLASGIPDAQEYKTNQAYCEFPNISIENNEINIECPAIHNKGIVNQYNYSDSIVKQMQIQNNDNIIKIQYNKNSSIDIQDFGTDFEQFGVIGEDYIISDETVAFSLFFYANGKLIIKKYKFIENTNYLEKTNEKELVINSLPVNIKPGSHGIVITYDSNNYYFDIDALWYMNESIELSLTKSKTLKYYFPITETVDPSSKVYPFLPITINYVDFTQVVSYENEEKKITINYDELPDYISSLIVNKNCLGEKEYLLYATYRNNLYEIYLDRYKDSVYEEESSFRISDSAFNINGVLIDTMEHYFQKEDAFKIGFTESRLAILSRLDAAGNETCSDLIKKDMNIEQANNFADKNYNQNKSYYITAYTSQNEGNTKIYTWHKDINNDNDNKLLRTLGEYNINFLAETVFYHPCISTLQFFIAKIKNFAKFKESTDPDSISIKVHYEEIESLYSNNDVKEYRCVIPIDYTKVDKTFDYKKKYFCYGVTDEKHHDSFRYQDYFIFYDILSETTKQIKLSDLLKVTKNSANSYLSSEVNEECSIGSNAESITMEISSDSVAVSFELLTLNQKAGILLGKFKQVVLGTIKTRYFIGQVSETKGLLLCKRVESLSIVSPIISENIYNLIKDAFLYFLVKDPIPTVNVAIVAIYKKQDIWEIANDTYRYTAVVSYCSSISTEICDNVTYFDIPNIETSGEFKISSDSSADVIKVSGNIRTLKCGGFERANRKSYLISAAGLLKAGEIHKGYQYTELSSEELQVIKNNKTENIPVKSMTAMNCFSQITTRASFSFKTDKGNNNASILLILDESDASLYFNNCTYTKPNSILLRVLDREELISSYDITTVTNSSGNSISSNGEIKQALDIKIPDKFLINEGDNIKLYGDIQIYPIFIKEIQCNKNNNDTLWVASPIPIIATAEKFNLQRISTLNLQSIAEIKELNTKIIKIEDEKKQEISGYMDIIQSTVIASGVFAGAVLVLSIILGWLFSKLKKQDIVLLRLLEEIHEMSSGKTKEQIAEERKEKERKKQEEKLVLDEIKPIKKLPPIPK